MSPLGATADPIEVSALAPRATGTTGAAGGVAVVVGVGVGVALVVGVVLTVGVALVVVAAGVAAVAAPANVGSVARTAAAPTAREAAAVAALADRALAELAWNDKRASCGWRAVPGCIEPWSQTVTKPAEWPGRAPQVMVKVTATEEDTMPGPGLFTDRYELTMLSSWLADGTAQRAASSSASPAGSPRAAGTGCSPVSAGCCRCSPSTRFDADEIAWLREVGAITDQCADYLATFRFTGDVEGYREGELYFPRLARAHRERHAGRVRGARDARPQRAQPRQRHRLGGRAHGQRRRRTPAHRDGQPAHPRAGRRRRRPRGLHRRLRLHEQPRQRQALRHPDRGHRRPRLHPVLRAGEGRVRRPGARARSGHDRCWSTPTTSSRASARRSRSPAPRSARSASTPATSPSSPAGPVPCSTRSAPPAPASP